MKEKIEIEITTDYIKLDQFLKLARIIQSGGEGKELILSGKIKVNNETEKRRDRKLHKGDEIEYKGEVITIK